jgi:chromosome segregation ATPase
LQEENEHQAEQLQEQARQIQHLEDRLVAWEYKVNKFSQSDERINQLKKELLEFITDRRQPGAIDSVLATQVENQTKILSTLTRDIEKTERYGEQIAMARTDFERLNKDVNLLETQLNKLQRQINDQSLSASYLEEQRRADARRLTELQGELPNLQKKVEANLLAKIYTIEQQIPQFAQYQMALEKTKEEARQHQEKINFQVAQQERQLKSWIEQSENYEQRMHRYIAELEKYAEQYQESRRALEAIHDFQERLQREQHQTSELQRLTEERQQAMFEKWKTDYEQRWQQQDSLWKPSVSEVQRILQGVQKQLDEIHKFSRATEEQLDVTLKIIEEDVYNRAMVAQNWQHRFEEIASGGQ